MYVDESGDSGLTNSPTRYFVLTGLVLHELRWQPCLDQLVAFRRRMKDAYGLRLREEIHAAALINKPGDLVRIPRNDRLTILREFADTLAGMTDLNLINIVVDKQDKLADYDVFGMAWKTLIQRFENTLSHRNFSGPANTDDRGIVFPDHTEDKKLVHLMRERHRDNLPLRSILEDPNFRNSADSYWVQAADLAAFLLYQNLAPSSYMRKKSGQNYFNRLDSILCRVAAPSDANGIVRL